MSVLRLATLQTSRTFLLTKPAAVPILTYGICTPLDQPHGLRRGYSFARGVAVPPEPDPKRTVAFFDGQNLFHSAREAFGYTYPNFEPKSLAEHLCRQQSWSLTQTRFYTGIASDLVAPTWHYFWTKKLAYMGTRGVVCFSRELRYRNQTFVDSNGVSVTAPVGQEKGIDVRIALDIVRLARKNALDVALVFSQDQDLAEVADEIRSISVEQGRWIKMACAFPFSPTIRNRRGINGTDWIKIDKATYDACLDPNDYRPPHAGS